MKLKSDYTPDGQIKSIRDTIQDKQGNQTEKLIATYHYNHLRQRVSKTTYDDKQNIKEEVQYLWDKGLLSAEIKHNQTTGKPQITRRYIYLDIMPVAILDYGYDEKGKLNKAEVYSIHTDHLGTPKQITNQHKEVVWSIEMDTFGETKDIQSKDNFQFNLRFAGQYFDTETGYHYNYHRYYDPKVGRYLTSDPIGLAGGLNSYGYANGRPYEFVDPLGLYSVSKDGITKFVTNFPLLKEFQIPTPPKWKDYTNEELLFHEYNMKVEVPNLTAEQKSDLQQYIIDNPTPSDKAKSALPNIKNDKLSEGRHNPAKPSKKLRRWNSSSFFAGRDDVVSYLITSNNMKFVVNVTNGTNHSLKHGILIRGIEDFGNGKIIMHHYGEGNSCAQSKFSPSREFINEIWYGVSELALESVTGKNYKINGQDWADVPLGNNMGVYLDLRSTSWFY